MNNRREFREIVKISREGSAPKSLLPKLFGALRLFILFFLFSSNAFGQNIQNQEYDINDPRNPNCPCHKLQKLADDEYQRIQNNDNNEQQQFRGNFNNLNPSDNSNNNKNVFAQNISNLNISDNNRGNQNKFLQNFDNIKQSQINFYSNGNDNSSHEIKRDFNFKSRELSIGSGSSGSKAKKKKSGTEFYKKLNRAKLKHSKIKKVRPNYSVCYKW